jgi:hypothetical protein
VFLPTFGEDAKGNLDLGIIGRLATEKNGWTRGEFDEAAPLA